ncbi:ABC transporter substrate-binding protein [Devosia rhodophyticola]|uniref:ABC transporter substrate-binding protein n=1 Tax=Devosia rhodophyticola TaxID=3026423 RepID=A0ABY7Z128_9HYPH|nr:ABC transporter substrate-binding protein [Devosia rhodophyticola]WDR07289.1 ABC transporter substrate-binding protein [Devosia rhodophyticola]
MTTRRKFTTILGMAALTAALGGTISAYAADMATVRIGVDPYTTGAQIWVAKESGFFEAHGIDAQISTYATGIEGLDATLTGNADIGVGLDFPTALRMQSKQMTILAAIFASNPGWHKLAVAADIQSAADLKGKSFGIATGTAQHLVTIKYLEQQGLTPDDYTLVPFSSLVEIVASLKAGRIDGGFVWADGVKMATDTPGIHILTDDSAAKLRQWAYVSANTPFAKNNRETVVNVLKAMNDATEFLKSNPDEAAAMIAKNTKAPQDSVRKLLDLNTFQLDLTDDERTGFGVIADFASGVIKTPVNFDTAVDPSYLEEAVPSAVTLSK